MLYWLWLVMPYRWGRSLWKWQLFQIIPLIQSPYHLIDYHLLTIATTLISKLYYWNFECHPPHNLHLSPHSCTAHIFVLTLHLYLSLTSSLRKEQCGPGTLCGLDPTTEPLLLPLPAFPTSWSASLSSGGPFANSNNWNRKHYIVLLEMHSINLGDLRRNTQRKLNKSQKESDSRIPY